MMQPRNYAELFLLTSKFFDISFTEKIYTMDLS